MGKLSIRGSAERVFPADGFRLSVTVTAESPVSSTALQTGQLSVEQLLEMFAKQLDLQPEAIRFANEGVRRGYGDPPSYFYSKSLTVNIPGSLAVLGRITEQLQTVHQTEFSVEPLLSNRSECEQAVLEAAVADSRAKAELIAKAMHARIIGADSAEMDGIQSEVDCVAPKCALGAARNAMADRLQNPEIRIQKEIGITWLTEPLE